MNPFELIRNFRPLLGLLLWVCALGSQAAQAREIDNLRIVRELHRISKTKGFEQLSSQPTVWEELEFLSEFSFDTWLFLSENRQELQIDREFLAPPKRQLARRLQKALSLKGGRLEAEVTSPVVSLSEGGEAPVEIQNVILGAYNQLQKSDRVYVWEMLDRNDRIPHYCRDECACVAQELAKALIEKFDGMKIYSVFMRGGDGAFVEVQRSLIKGMRGTSSYSYHMALLLKLGSNYFVLDPVVLGSAKLAKPSEWLRNFTMKSPISVEIFKVDSKK